jgi:hypothetical protein
MDRPSCHPYDTLKSELDPRFSKNLCTLEIAYTKLCWKNLIFVVRLDQI